jgi:hypothetical protein
VKEQNRSHSQTSRATARVWDGSRGGGSRARDHLGSPRQGQRRHPRPLPRSFPARRPPPRLRRRLRQGRRLRRGRRAHLPGGPGRGSQQPALHPRRARRPRGPIRVFSGEPPPGASSSPSPRPLLLFVRYACLARFCVR